MRWKWVVASVVLLVTVLLATAYAVLTRYDYNKLKPQLARMVKDATGRELALRGNIAFTLGFPPALIVTDAVLANAPWGSQPQMIAVDELRMEMRLLPLLARDVVLRYLGLSGVEVLLETGPHGEGNWDFTINDRPGERAAKRRPLEIDIGHIRIENLRLVVHRGSAGSAARYTIDRLDAAREENTERLAIGLQARHNGHTLVVSGRTGVIRHLGAPHHFPVEASGTYANAKVAVAGAIDDLLHLQGIELKAHVSGTDLKALGLDKILPLPQTSAFDVTGSLKGSKEALALEDVRGKFSSSGFDLNLSGNVGNLFAFSAVDLQLSGSGKDLSTFGTFIGRDIPMTDQFAFTGRLRGTPPRLSFEDVQASARRGSVRLNLNGAVKDLFTIGGLDLQAKGSGKDLAELTPIIGVKLPATDDFTVAGRLTGSAKSLAFYDGRASADRGSLKLRLSGGVHGLLAETTVSLGLNASGAELAEIGSLVGTDLPELGPFDVTAELAGSAKAVSLSGFSASIDKSDLEGQATVAFLERPRITARLTSSVIDFTRLMQHFEQEEKKPADQSSQPHRLFPDAALPLEALKKVDADILLNARNIRARDARLEFGRLRLKLENGDFSIDRIEATYKKTKISGNLAIRNATPPYIATKFLVQGFNLGDFLRETGKNDTVQAVVDIAAYGNSSGNSVHQLMANLSGSVGAVMGKGYLSRYLNMLSFNLNQKVLSFWDWARRHREKADQINCAVVQFDIKEGVASSRAFVFDSQLAVLTGEGEINLGNEQIDFLLVPDAKDTSIFDLSTNLRVRGSLMDPKVRPDTRSLLTQGSWALSSLAIGPLGLLAPFVHLGAHKAHPCDVPGIGAIDTGFPTESGHASP